MDESPNAVPPSFKLSDNALTVSSDSFNVLFEYSDCGEALAKHSLLVMFEVSFEVSVEFPCETSVERNLHGSKFVCPILYVLLFTIVCKIEDT